jgi:hypothetical protein
LLDAPPRSQTEGQQLAPTGAPKLSTRRLSTALQPYRTTLAVYAGSRLLLVAVLLFNTAVRHHAIAHQIPAWDGIWYRELANGGYPTHVLHARSVLGFFPLYPLMMWALAHAASTTVDVAGLIIAEIGGAIAAVLVQKLATGWWGPESGRRAAWLFCLFPGSVVFSMVYSEGVLLPLAAGCLLALQRRRWLTAGALAGFGTAVGPTSLVLIPVCAVAAGRELHKRGFTDRAARRSLLAPLLSLVGVTAFASYLWAWTGTPFATLKTQHYGWGERTDLFALVHQAHMLANQISFAHFDHPTINLNLVAGLVGAIVYLVGLTLLLKRPRQVSIEALTWTIGIGFLAFTSEYTPPNPRLLITAFPAVIVFAHVLKGRRYVALMTVNTVLFTVLSALTYVGTTLRP